MSGMKLFTQRARRVLSLAHEQAERMRQGYIGTEHLLLGLIQEEGGVAGRVLRELGLEAVRVEEVITRITGVGQGQPAKIDLSPGTQKALELAVEEARKMGHHYMGTEHLLLGLVRLDEGVAIDVLRKMGVTPEQIRRQTRRVLEEGSPDSSTAQPPSRAAPRSASNLPPAKKKKAARPPW